MKSTEEIMALLGGVLPELTREFGVTRLAIFGSAARGDARPDSDIDVLVDVDPRIGLRFVDLTDRIEEVLGSRADVVSRRALSPRHWAEIERDIRDVA